MVELVITDSNGVGTDITIEGDAEILTIGSITHIKGKAIHMKTNATEEVEKEEIAVPRADDVIVNNGLSLKRYSIVREIPLRKLTLNGEFIPGQIAWDIGKRDKWGCRKVIVHFEVYDGDNNETDSGQLVNLK